MHSLSLRLACSCSLVAFFACGGDDPDATTADTSSTPMSMPLTDSAAEDSEDPPTTSETGDGESSTGEPAPFEPIPARGGIEIDWVEANQGVGVKIGADGDGVPGELRNTYLLQNRVMLIRAFWKIPADWTSRKIEGRLVLSYPGESEPRVLKSTALVDGESFVGSLERSFYWGLMADDVIPGIKYRIELWETDFGAEDLPEPAKPARLPVDGGSTFIGIEASDQVLKITIVPFNYNDGGNCITTPDTSEATMQLFYDQMYMMNPVDTLEITMHEPVDWNEPLSDFNELNQWMSGMRDDEGAEPERYYFGLVDVCSGGLGGAGGKAFGIPQGAQMQDAWQRVSSGLSTDDTEWSSETFVHEVGHTQGRFHVFCNGEEAGTDPNYPPEYEHGEIGDWGFGVINFQLYHPTVHRDYMTYCHPVWASTYGWNKVYPNVKELSTWDNAAPPMPKPGDKIGGLLVGSIYPNGREDWITVRGGVRPEQLSAVHGVEFVVDGQPIHQPGAWLPQPDGDIVNLAVPLPDRFDEVSALTRVAGPERIAVDLSKIRQHHRPKPIKPAP